MAKYIRQEMDRSWFSKGTKGGRGVCSAPRCLRNARWSFVTAMGYCYGPGVIRLARCDLHAEPPSGWDWWGERERAVMDRRRLDDFMRERYPEVLLNDGSTVDLDGRPQDPSADHPDGTGGG